MAKVSYVETSDMRELKDRIAKLEAKYNDLLQMLADTQKMICLHSQIKELNKKLNEKDWL